MAAPFEVQEGVLQQLLLFPDDLRRMDLVARGSSFHVLIPFTASDVSFALNNFEYCRVAFPWIGLFYRQGLRRFPASSNPQESYLDMPTNRDNFNMANIDNALKNIRKEVVVPLPNESKKTTCPSPGKHLTLEHALHPDACHQGGSFWPEKHGDCGGQHPGIRKRDLHLTMEALHVAGVEIPGTWPPWKDEKRSYSPLCAHCAAVTCRP